jgi:hypothetical protein
LLESNEWYGTFCSLSLSLSRHSAQQQKRKKNCVALSIPSTYLHLTQQHTYHGVHFLVCGDTHTHTEMMSDFLPLSSPSIMFVVVRTTIFVLLRTPTFHLPYETSILTPSIFIYTSIHQYIHYPTTWSPFAVTEREREMMSDFLPLSSSSIMFVVVRTTIFVLLLLLPSSAIRLRYDGGVALTRDLSRFTSHSVSTRDDHDTLNDLHSLVNCVEVRHSSNTITQSHSIVTNTRRDVLRNKVNW